MPQNNPDLGVGGVDGVMVDCTDGNGVSSSGTVLLDAASFADSLSQQELDSLTGLAYHASDGLLLPQHQLVSDDTGLLHRGVVEGDGVGNVVEVEVGGGGEVEADHRTHLSQQQIGDMASMLQQIENTDHFRSTSLHQQQPSSTPPASFSIASSLDLTQQQHHYSSSGAPIFTTTPLFTTTATSPQQHHHHHQQQYTTTYQLSDELVEEVDSGIIADMVGGAMYATTTAVSDRNSDGGGTNVSYRQQHHHLLDATSIMDTSTGGDSGGSGVSIMDTSSSSGAGMDTSSMMLEEAMAADDGPNIGVHATVAVSAGGGTLKGVTQQIIRTSADQFILKQSQRRNEAAAGVGELKTVSLQSLQKQGLTKFVLSTPATTLSLTSSPHQQIRLLPSTAAPRTVLIGDGSGGRSIVFAGSDGTSNAGVLVTGGSSGNRENRGVLPGGGTVVGSVGSRSVVVGGHGAGLQGDGGMLDHGGSVASRTNATTTANLTSNNILGPITTKLTLQQAQKLGLLSPTKIISPTKIVMRPVSSSGDTSASRVLFSTITSNNIINNNNNIQTGPQTILLKSPAKIAPALHQNIGVRVVPSSGQHQKMVIRSGGTQQHKGVLRGQLLDGPGAATSQSVIRISAASPAVQAAAAAAAPPPNNNRMISNNNKSNVVRVLSPLTVSNNSSGGNKVIAPNTAQHIKIKPISIAPNNNQVNKQKQQQQQHQQQCVILPVSSNNILNSNNSNNTLGNKSNSVVMIPFQYLSQLQGSLSLSSGTGGTHVLSLSAPPPSATVLPAGDEPLQQQAGGTTQAAPAPPPRPPPKTIIDANGIKARKPCNCNKSQCLKLYCDCFANGEFCYNCNCSNCYNNLSHEEERQKAIKACLDRNPNAFKPKIGKGGTSTERRHNKGCNCKRSGCLKNYCECYEAKIPCSSMCKCFGCKNVDNSALTEPRKSVQLPPDPSSIMTSTGGGVGMHGEERGMGRTCSEGVGGYGDVGYLGMSRSSSVGGGGVVRNLGASPIKFGLPNSTTNSMSSPGGNPTSSHLSTATTGSTSSTSCRISQDVVSATCGCIIATASRCQKQGLERREMELAVIKEFSNCLQLIIEGCMQGRPRGKGYGGGS